MATQVVEEAILSTVATQAVEEAVLTTVTDPTVLLVAAVDQAVARGGLSDAFQTAAQTLRWDQDQTLVAVLILALNDALASVQNSVAKIGNFQQFLSSHLARFLLSLP